MFQTRIARIEQGCYSLVMKPTDVENESLVQMWYGELLKSLAGKAQGDEISRTPNLDEHVSITASWGCSESYFSIPARR